MISFTPPLSVRRDDEHHITRAHDDVVMKLALRATEARRESLYVAHRLHRATTMKRKSRQGKSVIAPR
jgi:hypothetical protein